MPGPNGSGKTTTGLTEATSELDRLTAALSAGRTELIDEHAAALTRWLALGGDDAGARADTAAGPRPGVGSGSAKASSA